MEAGPPPRPLAGASGPRSHAATPPRSPVARASARRRRCKRRVKRKKKSSRGRSASRGASQRIRWPPRGIAARRERSRALGRSRARRTTHTRVFSPSRRGGWLHALALALALALAAALAHCCTGAALHWRCLALACRLGFYQAHISAYGIYARMLLRPAGDALHAARHTLISTRARKTEDCAEARDSGGLGASAAPFSPL